MFESLFNEKLFREQLAYYKDIDYSGKIEYINDELEDQVIKEYLSDIATTSF